MTKKHKIEMILAAGVVIVLLLVLLFLWRKDVPIDTSPEVSQRPLPSTTAMPSVDPQDIPSAQAVSAETVARVFAERFGSYSSESDFANIDDVLLLATPQLQQSLRTLAEQSRSRLQDGMYYGTSTRVLSVVITEQTETATTLSCMTQRISSVDNPGNSTTTYQTLVLTLLKIGEEWKVDGYTWK
jgi:hypothetical protein